MELLIASLIILGLAFVQNISFSLVSRSRNRNNMKFHIIASGLSNTIWFITFRELILSDMSLWLLPSYMVGTITGSVLGVRISMRIEKWLGATSDDHVSKFITEERLNEVMDILRLEVGIPVVKKCLNFWNDGKTTSSTVCSFCGRERYEHKTE